MTSVDSLARCRRDARIPGRQVRKDGLNYEMIHGAFSSARRWFDRQEVFHGQRSYQRFGRASEGQGQGGCRQGNRRREVEDRRPGRSDKR